VDSQIATHEFTSSDPVFTGMGSDNRYMQDIQDNDFEGIPWA
jgi:hypothetical protein